MSTSQTQYQPTQYELDRQFDPDAEIVSKVMKCRDKRILVDGPYGTGKSLLIGHKIRNCCRKYPGCRWLVCRSIRKWMTNAFLVTWEGRILFKSDLIPDRIQRSGRSEYRFRNGSVVVIAGLDDPSSVLSAEYDGIFINEATEVPFETVEILDKRLRYGRMPYQQLLMDCNPAGPTHWLHEAFTAKPPWLTRLPMRHTDNPALYDKRTGKMTAKGRDYLGRLEDSSGVLKERGFHGRWVQSEGVVYEQFDIRTHAAMTKADLPQGWQHMPRVWVWDFGFNDPLVWQCWVLGPDQRRYRVHELYHTHMLPEDAMKLILPAVNGEPPPEAVICDHDRAERERLERIMGRSTIPATKGILANINAASKSLKIGGDGKPTVHFLTDALIHPPDPALRQSKHPISSIEEFGAYVWKKTPGAKGKDEPVDLYNHGMDCFGYFTAWADDREVIGDIQYGADARPRFEELGDIFHEKIPNW